MISKAWQNTYQAGAIRDIDLESTGVRIGLDESNPSSHIAAVNADQHKKAREQATFRPFTLFLSGQRRFEIRHPDFLWVVPGDRVVAVSDEKGIVELIDLLHVTSLKTDGRVDA